MSISTGTSTPSLSDDRWDRSQASTPLAIGLTIATGLLINHLVGVMHRRGWIYPKSVLDSQDSRKQWKWRNFLVSFVHATLTGVASLVCILQQPSLLSDAIHSFTLSGYLLTSLSLGYFLYDTKEMVVHRRERGSWEMILHHTLIVLCFGNTLLLHRYIGYTMIALMIELSNIFLHFRQLLLLNNVPRNTPLYRWNSWINLVIFILVRGGCLVLLWTIFLTQMDDVHWFTIVVGWPALSGFVVTSSILFYRLLKSDFGSNSRVKAQ